MHSTASSAPTLLASRFRGCLLGGAVGDALGAPVEFPSLTEIRARYGAEGIADLDRAYGRRGALTDDTQMTLFTAEGLLRALNRMHHRGICHTPSVVHRAYLRWLSTQDERSAFPHFESALDGWLLEHEALFARRAPGNTCLAALRSDRMGSMDDPINGSKGCGGVMRVAPVGLLAARDRAFDMGCELAAITHGHPSGYLAAGALSLIVALLRDGAGLEEAIDAALEALRAEPDSDECIHAVEAARALAASGDPTPEQVEALGGGWVAEEALAIALYCALVAEGDFAAGVRLAVNHSGDSDSTGAIAGNLLGVMLGEEAIPAAWLRELELRDVIEQIADDLFHAAEGRDIDWQRYPGH